MVDPIACHLIQRMAAEPQGDLLTDEELLRLAADALGYIQKRPPWDFDPTPMDADQVLTICYAAIAADRARWGRSAAPSAVGN